MGVFHKNPKLNPSYFYETALSVAIFFCQSFFLAKKGFPLQSLTQICARNNLYFFNIALLRSASLLSIFFIYSTNVISSFEKSILFSVEKTKGTFQYIKDYDKNWESFIDKQILFYKLEESLEIKNIKIPKIKI